MKGIIICKIFGHRAREGYEEYCSRCHNQITFLDRSLEEQRKIWESRPRWRRDLQLLGIIFF